MAPARAADRSTHLPLFGLVFALAILQACNCGASDAERFCAELAAIQCDREISCARASAAHREECPDEIGWRTGCPEQAERVSRGFARFDAEQGEACLEELRAVANDCSAYLTWSPSWVRQPTIAVPAAVGVTPEWPTCGSTDPSTPIAQSGCVAVFSPASSTGSACVDSFDCAEAKDGCARTESCEGTCQPGGTLGAPCPRDGCDPELYCNRLTWRCEERVPVGAECDLTRLCDFSVGYCDGRIGQCVQYPGEGEPCSFKCGPGLYCRSTDTISRVCARAGQLNETCEGYGTCDTGLLCIDLTCRLPGNEGDSCSGFKGCRDDLRCVSGICEPRLGEHGICNDAIQSCMQCETELACDLVLGTCERPRLAADGEPCTGSAVHCGVGLICRGAWSNPDGGAGLTGRCEPTRIGAPCQGSADCPSESYCAGAQDGGVGVCAAAHEGSPCTSGASCLVEHWCDLFGTRTCRAPRQEGEPCSGFFLDPSCASGLECAYTPTGPVCYRRRALDETCDPTIFDACQMPLGCVDGHCKEAGRIGEACAPPVGCKEGFCAGAPPGDSGRCEAFRKDGEACTWPFECAGGWCDSGKCVAVCR